MFSNPGANLLDYVVFQYLWEKLAVVYSVDIDSTVTMVIIKRQNLNDLNHKE